MKYYSVIKAYGTAQVGNVGITVKIAPPAQSVMQIINTRIYPFGNWAAPHPVGVVVGGNITQFLVQDTDLQLISENIIYPNEDALYSWETSKKDAIIGVGDYLSVTVKTALANGERIMVLLSSFVSTMAKPIITAPLGNTTITIDKNNITGIME